MSIDWVHTNSSILQKICAQQQIHVNENMHLDCELHWKRLLWSEADLHSHFYAGKHNIWKGLNDEEAIVFNVNRSYKYGF